MASGEAPVAGTASPVSFEERAASTSAPGSEAESGEEAMGERIQVTATLVQHLYAAIFPNGEMADGLGWATEGGVPLAGQQSAGQGQGQGQEQGQEQGYEG